jgi:hypothetical protein
VPPSLFKELHRLASDKEHKAKNNNDRLKYKKKQVLITLDVFLGGF